MLRIENKNCGFNTSNLSNFWLINFTKTTRFSNKLSSYLLSTLTISSMVLNFSLIQPALAEETILQTLTVTGKGMEMIPTTLTQVQLGVEIQGKNASELQQQVASKSIAVVNLLRSRQVEKLQTSGISLQPSYDYSNNERKFLGYIATNIVSFQIPTDKIGNLLDEAVKAGATRIDNLSFTAASEAIATAQKQALRKATLDAQQQAEAVLKTLNLTAKETISIKIDEANLPQPQLIRSEQGNLKLGDSTPVIGSEQTVQAAVTLQISY
jgi:hypothetical protein